MITDIGRLVAGGFLVLGTALSSGHASADGSNGSCIYIRGDAGVAISDVNPDFDTEIGYAVGGGFGCQFSEMLRGDITFDGAFGYEFESGNTTIDFDSYSVLGNFYIDFAPGNMFNPYLGVGAGYGIAEASVPSFRDIADGFAYAGMGGVGIAITDSIILDVGYKYMGYTNFEGYLGNHMIRSGLRFGF